MKPSWPHLREIAEEQVEQTLRSLPDPLLEQVRQLPVTLEPVPNDGLQADGILPDTLGLFTGAGYAEEGAMPLPPQIILFLENLWAFADGDEATYRKEIHTTLLHELGHYLGLGEDDLTERGLD